MPMGFTALGLTACLFAAAPPGNRGSGAASPANAPAEGKVPGGVGGTDAGGPSDETSAAAYDERAALVDLEIVITQTGKPFLAARERLEAAPEATRAGLRSIRTRSDLDAAARARLDAVERRLPDLATTEELREKIISSAKLGSDIEELLERLASRGAEAAPHLLAVARERELPVELRARLLERAVEVSASLVDYLPYVGGGDPKLQRALRRALVQRARVDAQLRQELLTGLAEAAPPTRSASSAGEAPSPEQQAGRMALRAALGEIDEATIESWTKASLDDTTPFIVRVAALRALGGDARAEPALERTARAMLPGAVPANGPSGESSLPAQKEVLGAIALAGLGDALAARLVTDLGLTSAAAPRIAAAAWRVVSVPNDPNLEWLLESRNHAWPEVRVAALDRVGAGCSRVGAKRLADIAGRDERAADPEPQVARAAIRALGRCQSAAGESALRGVLADPGIRVELRGDAALALVESSAEGVTSVAKALLIAEDEALAEVLLDALATAESLPASAGDAGCTAAPRFARLAPRALRIAARAVPAGACVSAVASPE